MINLNRGIPDFHLTLHPARGTPAQEGDYQGQVVQADPSGPVRGTNGKDETLEMEERTMR